MKIIKSKKFSFFFSISILVIIVSCSKKVETPKPIGYPRLEYPKPNFLKFSSENCPYTFYYSDFSFIEERKNKNCWYNINYPKMKATIYITYTRINKNIFDLIKEAQKMVNEHKIKANSIKIKSFEYPEKKVYGNFYRLGGETASNIQFYITDSVTNFISGDLYFKVRPKPDSLKPAIDYVEKDIIHIINSFEWKPK